MKAIHTVLIAAQIGFGLSGVAAASTESTIRELEQVQVRAAIARDRAQLEKIFAPDFRIINPSGAVATREELFKILIEGSAPYQSAAYQTDIVRDYGNVVVTVGMDTVVPNQGPSAGKTVLRRVTQVWKRDKGVWRLTLRQANIITAP